MEKICKQCGGKFKITESDLKFYERVSPVFAGKKYQVPAPDYCHNCRFMLKAIFRNERKLYADKCDLCGRNMISLYSPDKLFKAYCQECFYSDKWDAAKYGMDIDFDKPFFEQFKELQKEVPRMSIFNINCQNSEYTNHSFDNKDCYMGVAFGTDEDCMYGHWVVRCKDCVDGLYLDTCDQCYESCYLIRCYKTFYSQYCENMKESLFCYDCRSCDNCIGCAQLHHKNFHVLNKSVSEEEFIRVRDEIMNSLESFNKYKAEWIKLKDSLPHRPNFNVNVENSTGNDLLNCKNVKYSFNCRDCEDCKYVYDLANNKDSMDCYEHGWMVPSELNYEAHAGMSGTRLLFCNICSYANDLLYCDLCMNNCSDLFGCVCMTKKKYCILNKQYSKEEYEKLVPKLIEKLIKEGVWGKFISPECSPFGYNETTAIEYFPIGEEEAKNRGFNWCEYESPPPDAKKIISGKDLPEKIEDVKDDILDYAIKCEKTGKLFKLTTKELMFYKKYCIRLPRRHPDQRHLDRVALRPGRKLYERKCAKCGEVTSSVYSENRLEKIYCESCYLKTVY